MNRSFRSLAMQNVEHLGLCHFHLLDEAFGRAQAIDFIGVHDDNDRAPLIVMFVGIHLKQFTTVVGADRNQEFY